MTLEQLIQDKKNTAFVDGYNASDDEALGLLIAQYFEHDGEQIFRTMFYAMEDANFHDFNAKMKAIWENDDDD